MSLLFVTVRLERKLKKFELRNQLISEKKIIRNQSIAFCAAFLTGLIYNMQEIWRIAIKDTPPTYIVAVIRVLFWIPWSILPISVVFYHHHITYKEQL